MTAMAPSHEGPLHNPSETALPRVPNLKDPVLIMLPDGGVRLYHEDLLRAADVTREYPGYSLSNRGPGSRRPPLEPSFPLRSGGTYFLVPAPVTPPAPRKGGRLSLEVPCTIEGGDGRAKLQEFDIEDFRAELRLRAQASPGEGLTAAPTNTFRSLVAQSGAHHSESAIPVSAPQRQALCPYCAPHDTLALSATWQLCAAHSGGRRVIRSSSQNAAALTNGKIQPPAQLVVAPQPDWLDESCCFNVATPQGNAKPVKSLSVSASPIQEKKENPILLELQDAREKQSRGTRGAAQQQRAAPASQKQCNPILEEIWDMERSSTASRSANNSSNGINPILEELWDTEEAEETQKPEGSGKLSKSGSTKKVLGKFLNGVRRVASWKPRGAKSSEDVLAGAPPRRKAELDSWNALPTSFTSAV